MHSICGTVCAPRCHLILHLPSHQSPTPSPVGPLQRGNQRRSLPERKNDPKEGEKKLPHVYEPFNTIHRKTRLLSVLPLWPIHTYPGKKKADNQIVGSGFLATGFSSEMASIKFLRFAPTSTIPLCRLPSWRRAWLSIQTFPTVIYYQYRAPPSILPGQYLWKRQHRPDPYCYLPYTHISLPCPLKL